MCNTEAEDYLPSDVTEDSRWLSPKSDSWVESAVCNEAAPALEEFPFL
jgi:hypothetical protein